MKVKIKTDKEVEITKEDFADYERVRQSGKTNMFDIRMVENLSDSLSEEKIRAIISNFEALMKKYPDVYGQKLKRVI